MIGDLETCAYCGKKFPRTSNNQKYCNERSCRSKRVNEYNKEHLFGYTYHRPVAEESPLRQPPKMTLEEKSALMKSSGISYPELQQIVDKAEDKDEVIRQVERWKRKRFREQAERNADGVRVHTSNIGCTHGCSTGEEY